MGVGFLVVRIRALIGLASEALLAYDLTAQRGKGGEQTVLYGLLGLIQAIQSRVSDVVMAQHGRRSSDFAPGQTLGRHDHIVPWRRLPRPE